MKVVILRGSPRKNGITNQIVDEVFKDLDFEYKIYDAYDDNIAACIACDYCFDNENECVIIDDFQQMVADIDQADLVVMASPLHFSVHTGKLLSMISRFQYLFALKYHHRQPIPFKNKYGLTITTGGNDYKTMFEANRLVDKIVFDHINAFTTDSLNIKKTDDYSIEELIVNYQEDITRIRKFISEIK